MSDASAGRPHLPALDASTQVRLMVERGFAVPIQAKIKSGYIVYEFLGGAYDGVKMRLYPPFQRRLLLRSEWYAWGAPKNGRSKRFTYRLEGADG